jgi:DNA-binding response OmpR family regulator
MIRAFTVRMNKQENSLMIHPRQRIMIVEDDLSLLYSLGFTLKRQKYLVGMSSNGKDALRILFEAKMEEKPFDLLIVDMVIPGIAGLELIDKLHEQGIAMPVLVITGRPEKNLIAQLEKRGIRELLAKPFNSVELIMRISSVFKGSSPPKFEL